MNIISSKELFAFTFFLSCFLFPGFGDTIILAKASNATIITSIIGFLLGFIPLGMILYIRKHTNNKNIFLLNKEKFKGVGVILNALLIVGIIFIIFNASWSIVNFTISQFLSRTSYFFVIVCMSLLVYYAVIKNTEIIGRTGIILIIIFFMFALFALSFLTPNLEINNLLPLIDISEKELVKSSFLFTTFNSLPLISLLFIKNDNISDSNKANKKILLGYILAGVFAITFFVFIIGVFGIDLARLFTYPEYSLFKTIQAFNFIERIENVLSVIIFIATFMGFCVINLFIKEYIRETFKIKKEKTLNICIIISCVLIPIISTFMFKNFTIIEIYTNYPYISLFIFIPLTINFFLLLIKRSK